MTLVAQSRPGPYVAQRPGPYVAHDVIPPLQRVRCDRRRCYVPPDAAAAAKQLATPLSTDSHCCESDRRILLWHARVITANETTNHLGAREVRLLHDLHREELRALRAPHEHDLATRQLSLVVKRGEPGGPCHLCKAPHEHGLARDGNLLAVKTPNPYLRHVISTRRRMSTTLPASIWRLLHSG